MYHPSVCFSVFSTFFGWLFPVRVFVILLSVSLSFCTFLQLFLNLFPYLGVVFDLSFLSSSWLFVSVVFLLFLVFVASHSFSDQKKSFASRSSLFSCLLCSKTNDLKLLFFLPLPFFNH